MAFNTGGALGGAMSGASMGSMFGPIGTGLGALAGGALGGFMGGGEDTELEDMRTPEQKAAAKMLQDLAMTGSGGGINLGALYGGDLGSYDTSGSQTAYNQLQSIYGGPALNTAQNTLMQLTDLKFNPDDPSSGYAAFSRQLAKAGKDASSVIDRESAITGNRFGTAILGEKRQLAENLADQSAMQLASLYNNQQNRAMNAASGLQNVAANQATIAQQAAQQAQMVNAMKDQQAKDKLNEFQRARNEELTRLNLLQTEANRNPYLGVSSIPGESPFSSLLSPETMKSGISSLGGMFKSLFSPSMSSQSKILGFDTRAFS